MLSFWQEEELRDLKEKIDELKEDIKARDRQLEDCRAENSKLKDELGLIYEYGSVIEDREFKIIYLLKTYGLAGEDGIYVFEDGDSYNVSD